MKKENYNWGKTEPFFPNFLFKEAIAALLFFIVFMLIVVFSHVPLEAVADPTDTTYIPRPEWYFMFLFQLLKYFPGQLEPLAVVVLPGIGMLLLLFLPFYDTRKERKPSRRPLASAAAAFGLAGIIYLTTMGIATTPPPPVSSAAATKKLTTVEAAGKKVFQDSGCAACHQPGGAAPELTGIAERRDANSIAEYIKNPKSVNPSSTMPPFASLSDDQMQALMSYLATLK
ncbi:MAG: c-type cytochrome [Chloroflexi bacterium]|nr:c-type cytochrome [Chloroflexota bacterium]